MKKYLVLFAVVLSGLSQAQQPNLNAVLAKYAPKLYVLRGQIREVTITATTPATKEKVEKGLIDESCAEEVVKFSVSEYVVGSGDAEVTFRKGLPSYNCVSSWPNTRQKDGIALLYHFDEFSNFKGFLPLEEIDSEPGLLNNISIFLGVANVFGGIDPSRLLQDLKQPIIRKISISDGADSLKRLQDIGVLTFEKSEIDLNQGCIAGCREDHLLPAYLVAYKKFIPLSKIRAYGF